MKNISGNAEGWVEPSEVKSVVKVTKETVNVQDEMTKLLEVQSKLFTKYLKSSNKNIGDSLIVLDSVIKSLELN